MKHLIMCTAGHIDHGKTSLIKAMTGFDCDTHPQEKERGITINPGFTNLDLPLSHENEVAGIGVVDVPGHHRFIRNMVAGACGVDFALMVVAADDGVMPQTREHLAILDCLGVQDGVIAITKEDLADSELLDMVRDEIAETTASTCLQNAKMIPVSSTTGHGLDTLREAICETVKRLPERSAGRIFRLYVDRVFSVSGFGTVVTGSVMGGRVRMGDTLHLLPPDKETRVRRIERHDNEVQEVQAGDRASFNLAGLKRDDFSRGMLLADRQLDCTARADVELTLIDPAVEIGIYSKAMLYAGTHETMARIHLLDVDRARGGDTVLAQLELESPTVLLIDDRLIIRSCSADRTLGGGRVIDPAPLHHRRRPEQLIRQIRDRTEGDLVKILSAEAEKQLSFLCLTELARLLDREVEELEDALKNADLGPNLCRFTTASGTFLLSAPTRERYEKTLLGMLEKRKHTHPLSNRGLTPETMAAKLNLKAHQAAAVMTEIFEELAKQDRLDRAEQGGYVAHGWKASPSANQSKAIEFLRKRFCDAGVSVILLSDVEEEINERLGVTSQELKIFLSFLTEETFLTVIDGSYVWTEMVESCRRTLLKHLTETDEGITVAGFRDLVEGNRKICLLLFALYDKEGFTARRGDLRFITTKGREYIKHMH